MDLLKFNLFESFSIKIAKNRLKTYIIYYKLVINKKGAVCKRVEKKENI